MECQLGRLRLNSDFIFDGLDGFGGDVDKLDAYPDSPQAIADLTASLDGDAGSREPEAQFQDRALRILGSSVDEHTVRAEVWRPDRYVFLESFVNHREVADLWIAFIPPYSGSPLFFLFIHS
jgi:hypothetical protein